MAVQITPMTAAAFWAYCEAIDASHGPHLELVNGEVVEMSPTGGEHGVLTFELGLRVGGFVRERQLGYVTAAETGFRVSSGGRESVLAPDVAFVSSARLPGGPPREFIPFAPDLAVEVLSPSDAYSGVQRKAALYLAGGSQAVWVVDSLARSVTIYATDADGGLLARTWTPGMILDGAPVLPGFQLSVDELFSVLG